MKKYYILMISFSLCYAPAIAPSETKEAAECHCQCASLGKKDVLYYSGILTLGAIATGVGMHMRLQEAQSEPNPPFPPPPARLGSGCWSIAMINPGPHMVYGQSFKPLCAPVNATFVRSACPDPVKLDFMEMRPSECSRTQCHPCYSEQEVTEILPKFCKRFIERFPPLAEKPKLSSHDKLTERIETKESARKRR